MHKLRLIFCFLLVAAMICSFSACDRTSSDEGDKESNAPAETGGEASTAPPSETPDEATAAVSSPSNPYEGRSDLVILNWEEYENRPHGIQPGTVLNYAGYDLELQLPWDCYQEGWFTDNIYEGLLYMYMNDPEDIRGCIAESWSHSDDYLTWTFQIRDGVKFHDGTICDAYAVAESWDCIFAKKHELPHMDNSVISSWEATSAKEFIVRLSAPCAYFEVAATGEYTPIGVPLLIVSPTALKTFGSDDNRAAIGTGPYYIDSHVGNYFTQQSIVLKANPDYYLEERMPCIETVNYLHTYKYDATFKAILDGEIDGANQSYYFYDKYNLQENGYDGHYVACYGETSSIWFKADVAEVFSTYEVRKAMCRFVDFHSINDSVYSGLGRVQDSIWAESIPGYVQTDRYYYDPDEGRELLASVGMVPSDIKFSFAYTTHPWETIGEVVVEWEKAGVQIDLTVIRPEDSFLPKLDNIGLMQVGSGYTGILTAAFWMRMLMGVNTPYKVSWQELYGPDLYRQIQDEYDAMIAAATWYDMLEHAAAMTKITQDIFGAVACVQAPNFIALSKDFKNGVYFSEDHDIQLYYLYR